MLPVSTLFTKDSLSFEQYRGHWTASSGKNLIITKQATLMRRSIVMSIPLQLVFPGLKYIYTSDFANAILPCVFCLGHWKRFGVQIKSFVLLRISSVQSIKMQCKILKCSLFFQHYLKLDIYGSLRYLLSSIVHYVQFSFRGFKLS